MFKNENYDYEVLIKDMKSYQYNIASTTEVILCYILVLKHKDGKTLTIEQRTQFSWIKKNKEWKIAVINTSNSYNILEVNSKYIYVDKEVNLENDKRLKILDKSNTLNYVDFKDLYWIQSDSYNSIVHTKKGIINARDSVRTLTKKYDFLLRVHSSFLINKNYVDSIHRFYIIMKDGSKIPVPEKKYTMIKNIIEEDMKK